VVPRHYEATGGKCDFVVRATAAPPSDEIDGAEATSAAGDEETRWADKGFSVLLRLKPAPG
jgi:hypothetical protein